jgi:prepilin-type N-terminal cleavage/methylation domain-containing protein
MRGPESGRGFTLVEMLVALAILSVLMVGLVILFNGSLRATQSGYLQMDAFERARAALTVIETDLVTGFTAHQQEDLRSFYGTPIGMTFIGVVRDTVNPTDVNIARITYAIYSDFDPATAISSSTLFENALEQTDQNGTVLGTVPAYTYYLVRYIEPNVGDLDSFPVAWTDPILQALIDGAVCQATDRNNNGVCAELMSRTGCYLHEVDVWSDPGVSALCRECVEDAVRAKKRELWIRMIAGGDREAPSAWQRPEFGGKKASDYVVTGNILSTVPPGDRYNFAGDNWYAGIAFFDYDYAYEKPYDPGEPGAKRPNLWWNDWRSLNCNDLLDWRIPAGIKQQMTPSRSHYCEDPRVPEIVTVGFWLMFDSPYPGAPEFKRRFSLEMYVPAGYIRQQTTQ